MIKVRECAKEWFGVGARSSFTAGETGERRTTKGEREKRERRSGMGRLGRRRTADDDGRGNGSLLSRLDGINGPELQGWYFGRRRRKGGRRLGLVLELVLRL